MTRPTRSVLDGDGREDRHLLHVVDEQRDRLAVEAPGDSPMAGTLVCAPDPVTKTMRSA